MYVCLRDGYFGQCGQEKSKTLRPKKKWQEDRHARFGNEEREKVSQAEEMGLKE